MNRLLALLPVLLTTGCLEPALLVNGTVRSAPETCSATAGGDAYASGQPLAGASVVMRCPERRERTIAHTDAGGRFRYSNVDVLSRGCTVIVDAPGYWPQTFATEEVCQASSEELCAFVNLHAELVPRPSPKNR